MKLKTLLTTIFFITSLSAGSALANYPDPAFEGAQPQANWRAGAAEGQRGSPEHDPRAFGEERDRALFTGQDRYEFIGIHSADDMIGRTVVSREGEDLGRIQNLLFSEDGQIDYVVISRGGVRGWGGALVPIPWEAANLQVDQDDRLRADLSRQEFAGAPTLVDLQTQIASPQYEQRIHGYYGTEPQTRR